MSSLRDIRRRLKSVENIKKITDAMERVAAARLRRAQELAENTRPYANKLKDMVEKLARASEDTHPLFIKRPVLKRALIVVNADKGLCGTYNSNIINAAETFLRNQDSNQIALLLFGKKGIEYFKNKKWTIDFEKNGWGGRITLPEIEDFCTTLIADFLNEKYDEVWLLYTHYISIANRSNILSKFLPIDKPKNLENSPDDETVNYIFEPDAESIFPELMERYCATRIQEILYESYASELAARIMAMQMASKNSEEMISKLTRVRNKVRQEGITREMIEIASGMEEL